MRCPSCSSAVADGRRFCPSCGTPQTATVGAAATARAAAAPYPAEPNPPAASGASPATAVMAVPNAATGYADVPADTAAAGFPTAGQAPTVAVGSPNAPVDAGATTAFVEPLGHDGTAGTAGHLGRPADGGHADRAGHAGRSGRGFAGGAGDALAGAGDAVLRRARRAADSFGAAPAEVRVAMIGAAVTVLSFLALPYADEVGTAARVGGRLWWRPITAVVATILLATTLRVRAARATATKDPATTPNPAATDPGTTNPATTTNPPATDPGATDHGATDHGATDHGATHLARAHNDPARAGGVADRLLAALVVATVGATEAGLVGLFSGDARGTRIGYYGMLAGLVAVLGATARAARRRCGGGTGTTTT